MAFGDTLVKVRVYAILNNGKTTSVNIFYVDPDKVKEQATSALTAHLRRYGTKKKNIHTVVIEQE